MLQLGVGVHLYSVQTSKNNDVLCVLQPQTRRLKSVWGGQSVGFVCGMNDGGLPTVGKARKQNEVWPLLLHLHVFCCIVFPCVEGASHDRNLPAQP